jgi:hypothetical protein
MKLKPAPNRQLQQGSHCLWVVALEKMKAALETVKAV